MSKNNNKVKESKESKDLRKNLENIQKLLNTKNTNLSEDEKLLANQIVATAESRNIIAPFLETDENGLIFNFKLDYGSKEIFKDLSDSIKIEAFNHLLKSKFDTEDEMSFGFTEYFKTIGKNKYFSRGDLSAIIKNGIQNEITNVVLVEIQAKHDSEVLERFHSYGNNNLKLIEIDVKRTIDGKEVTVKEEVFVRPYEMLIYASTKFEKKEGVFRFNVTAPEFEFNGEEKRGDKGDIITYLIPYINIFQMTLEELNNSKFYFLQCLYLYRYRQDKDLLEKEEKIVEIMTQIEKNLEKKLTPEDFAVAIKQHRNLFVDICNMAEQNPDKFRKVRDNMYAARETFVDKIQREAIEEFQAAAKKAKKEAQAEAKKALKEAQAAAKKAQSAAKKAQAAAKKAREKEVNMILNMMRDNLSDTIISNYAQMPLEEIAKIREDHLNKE